MEASRPITAMLRQRLPASSRCALRQTSITVTHRTYATQTGLGATNSKPPPRRKEITLINDDGRVPWTNLSAKEKVSRTTQQSFNFLTITAGLIMTGGVAYFLFSDVFSPNSRTVQFNKAVDRIRADPEIQRILGDGKKIRAFGEASWSRWTRNRPIASTASKDKMGTEHIHMHFHVEGPLASGVARVHMAKTLEDDRFEYILLAVDVPGFQRVFLENTEGTRKGEKASGRLFGVKWW